MVHELLLETSVGLWKCHQAIHEVHDQELKELIEAHVVDAKEGMWNLVTLLQRRPLLLPSDYIYKGSEYGK
ncbi:hypothetical protein MM817_01275 [Acidibacillus sp. S0AB]|uniref:Uncharacterized protein n=2 Tax=Sulfoacidibacillus ferrooxidans TaxID=2005001 RepID=A0A9X1V925_9BACL|nr:hypothetical protein [Sulfoacidibacillus ferrooxidans]